MEMGINLSGGEYSPENLTGPIGSNYGYPSHDHVDYYAAKGFTLIRLPVLWERLQPEPGGELDPVQLAAIKDFIDYATSMGLKVDIDIHNYGEGYGHPIGSAETPVAAFADLWARIATEFIDNPDVIFGLMNEPAAIDAIQWLEAANAAIAAIREVGATQEIYVAGAYYSTAALWFTTDNSEVIGAPGAIVDPLNNFTIEVHQYLDDNSGTNTWVVSETIGVERLTAITEWARENGIQLVLGEFGVNANEPSIAAMKVMLDFLSENADVWKASYYQMGGLWAENQENINSTEPTMGINDQGQMEVLENYTGATKTETALADGTTRIETFVPGVEHPTVIDILDAEGAIVMRSLHRLDGSLSRTLEYNEDGTHTLTTYDANGQKPVTVKVFDAGHALKSETVFAADGTSETTHYADIWTVTRIETFDAEGTPVTVVDFGVSGALVETYENGTLSKVELYDEGWSLTSWVTFDASGAVTSVIVTTDEGNLLYYEFENGALVIATLFDAFWSTIACEVYDAAGNVIWSTGPAVPSFEEVGMPVMEIEKATAPEPYAELDFLFGSAEDDVLVGTGGDDWIFAGGGRDFVDGQGGTDVFILSGSHSEYGFRILDSGYLEITDTVAGRDGVSTLANIDKILFKDGLANVAELQIEGVTPRTDAGGQVVGYTHVKVENGTTTHSYFDLDWTLEAVDFVTVEGDRTTTHSFDGDWAPTGITLVERKGAETTTMVFDKDWTLLHAEIRSETGNTVQTLHYDGSWNLAGVELKEVKGDQTIIQQLDADWRLKEAVMVEVKGVTVTTYHFDADWQITGAEIATVQNGVTVVRHYDSDWTLLGETQIAPSGSGEALGKLAGTLFSGAETLVWGTLHTQGEDVAALYDPAAGADFAEAHAHLLGYLNQNADWVV